MTPLILVVNAENTVRKLVENVDPTAIIATTMMPASIAYSSAVTPRSSRFSRFRYFSIDVVSPRNVTVTNGVRVIPGCIPIRGSTAHKGSSRYYAVRTFSTGFFGVFEQLPPLRRPAIRCRCNVRVPAKRHPGCGRARVYCQHARPTRSDSRHSLDI
jgi:hypothetical protein